MFKHLNEFILGFENLESLELIGMSIVDNLGDLVTAVKRPKLKKLSLPYNGIEHEFCLYFQHMLNFDTLQHLDLSCNWFGMNGLSRFKDHFKQFKQLAVLNLSNNKLCAEEQYDIRQLRDLLHAVKGNLQELYLAEN